MTLQMYLLEEKMEAEDRRAEKIAIKLIRRGRPIQEIHEDTDLSLERINELVQATSKEKRNAKLNRNTQNH